MRNLLDSPADVTTSKAWGLVIAGYSTLAVGVIAFLTINGASGTSAAAVFGSAGLISIGLVLPAAGILQVARRINPTEGAARKGFVMQGLGLIGLVIGLGLVWVASSVPGYLASAAVTVMAAASGVTGAVLLESRDSGIGAAKKAAIAYLVLGTGSIFLGVGLIAASNIAYQYMISDVQNTVYVDVGATVFACGSVLSAYSFFTLRSRTRTSS